MRLKEPRVPPLAEDEWPEEVRERHARTGGVQGGRVLNIFTTLARHSFGVQLDAGIPGFDSEPR